MIPVERCSPSQPIWRGQTEGRAAGFYFLSEKSTQAALAIPQPSEDDKHPSAAPKTKELPLHLLTPLIPFIQ